MTSKLHHILNERKFSTTGLFYRSSLSDNNRRLRIEIYDNINPPKKYHNKRLDVECLENVAKSVFSNIDFICDNCIDAGMRISFTPKSADDKSQKYFGHYICVDETSSLVIIIQTNKKVPTLSDSQRNSYAEYASRVITEYGERGKSPK